MRDQCKRKGLEDELHINEIEDLSLRLNDLKKWFEEHNDRSEDYLQLLEIKKRLDELLMPLESRCQGACCKTDEKRG